MTIQHRQALASLRSLLRLHSPSDLKGRLAPKPHDPAPKVPSGSATSPDAVAARWAVLSATTETRAELLDERTAAQAHRYERNVENFIGTVKVPVGVIGPVRVNGTHAQGDYHVPLATTEAALVASYGRGASLLSAVGGCAAVTIDEGIARSPGFAFTTLYDAGQFIAWVLGVLPTLATITESTSRYARLKDTRVSLEGNHVYLIFDFHTGDAAGQNMATIATHAICSYIVRESPVKPVYTFLEANHSGDKKASAQSFIFGRGRSVTAEVVIPAALVRSALHTTPEVMADYFRMSAIGGVLSGTIGIQGHFANGLAAIYLACGQDVACVAESAVGVTRLEVTSAGALYAAVTLPNLTVGTVGGGTGLPSQSACLAIMGLAGPGNAAAFAEVCAAVVLGGELSIVGALAANEFAAAHERLARGAVRTTAEQGNHAERPATRA
ncbi:MAG: hydroxymethylglutaryl-CoA reductase [Gemmatimonadaceae bacterium]